MDGGRDYRQSQFNRVTQSHRQPGSAFKPVTYLAALQETFDGGPAHFLPTSYIDDKPFTWQFGATSWTPKNYKDRYFGRVTLEFALEESLNSATLRLADAVGLDRVLAMAGKLGFGNLPPYPSVVLGGIEVEPMQLGAMYAILANEGMEVQPYAVTAVVSAKGQVIEGHELKAVQVLAPEVAYSMDFMLEQVIKHGTGMGARKAGFLRPAAGKSGTTNDSVDAWFAGFTPNLLAVVWTGFDQKEALGLTGAEASLPVWTDFMKAATAARPDGDFPMPSEVVRVQVDPLTGYLASRHCPVTMEGVFPKAMTPLRMAVAIRISNLAIAQTIDALPTSSLSRLVRVWTAGRSARGERCALPDFAECPFGRIIGHQSDSGNSLKPGSQRGAFSWGSAAPAE